MIVMARSHDARFLMDLTAVSKESERCDLLLNLGSWVNDVQHEIHSKLVNVRLDLQCLSRSRCWIAWLDQVESPDSA